MDIRNLGNSYLVLALFLGALLPVMLDLAQSINIYEFLFLAYAISVPASLLFVIWRGKWGRLSAYLRSGKDLAIIALVGLLNYALLEFGLAYAEHFVSASLATVVYRTFPLLMLIFIPFVLKERISRYQILALALAFVGLYIACSGGTLGLFSGIDTPIILFLVVVALASALAGVLVKRFVYDMESCMFIFNLANFLFFGAIFAASGLPASTLQVGSLLPIIYVGVVYNVFVGFMYYWALRVLKTTFVTNIYFLSPFLTIVFAYALLGETIRWYYLAIAALVAVGIVIQRFDRLGGTFALRGVKKGAEADRDFFIFDVTGAFADTGEVTIGNAIRNGGRVLAVKLNNEHAGYLGGMTGYSSVLTDKDVSDRESRFLKELLGAEGSDMVVLKAGDENEGHRFFTHLSGLIGGDPRAE